MLKKTIYILLFSSICSFVTHAQEGTIAPKYSNEFLAIGVGAEAMGMGNAVVANVQNVNASYWNPSGLLHVNKWLEVGVMHSEYFAGIAKYDYLGLAHTIDSNSAVGFSAIRFGVDNIPNTTQLIDQQGNIDYSKITIFSAVDYGFLFSYARKMKIPGLNVGGNFKIVHRKVGDFAKSWGFGIDASAQYKYKKWKFGLMARDVTSTFNAWMFSLNSETKEIFLKTGNELPQNGLELTLPKFILGAYRNFNLGKKGIYTAGEVDWELTVDGKRNTLIRSGLVSIDPKIGIEIGYKTYVAVRLGVSNFQKKKDFDDKEHWMVQPHVGIGLAYKNFYLDYAFTNVSGFSSALYSNIVSIRIKLNKPKPQMNN